ncbi:hypothetical protein [Nocardiopsis lucentensis]|uniref:hypothetical protein n=1 Tax=Nocardiopsis lucentensis TaxID=53441 RepID=UPI000348D72C|nr:hypothetical protein [Nocardiopsis lucentensis]
MNHRTPPREITLPPAAATTIRRVDGLPVLVVTDPDTGTEQVIRFAGDPADAKATADSLSSAALYASMSLDELDRHRDYFEEVVR